MTHRTTQHLAAIAREYPDCWRTLDELRADVAAQGVTWPPWCWLPVAASYAVVSGGGEARVPLERSQDVGRLAALSSWRVTQGVYRLDETLLGELWASDLDGALPVDTLLHLPEWCVYIETPGRRWEATALHGFFAHLEYEPDTHNIELRLVVDTDAGLLPAPLPLGHGEGTIADSWRVLAASALQQAERIADPVAAAAIRDAATASGAEVTELLRPLLSTLLYVCTSGEVRPTARPTPVKKHGLPRYYPPAKPRVEVLGERLGASLRAAALREGQPALGSLGGSVTPHVRRAHWHTYLLGPRDGTRRREVRWQPPIFVRLGESDDATPTVRHVVREKEQLS